MGGLAKKLIASAGQDEKLDASDVFSTYLYTGNGSTQTINNGIDLAGEGGLVWIKDRSAAGGSHSVTDTVRGLAFELQTNTTAAQATQNRIASVSSSGFTLANTGSVTNGNGVPYASWTFRKAPKFFDVVTYTGDGTSGRVINHSLGQAPGMIIVKAISGANSTQSWAVYHRGIGATKGMTLSGTDAAITSTLFWNNIEPTASGFSLGTAAGVNGSATDYVAYLFAHDTASDGLIQCGSFTSSASALSVTLGWEPQFLLVKRTSSADNWMMVDASRGLQVDRSAATLHLLANTSGAESGLGLLGPTATGFTHTNGTAGDTYIYLAIRRPNKPPTSGSQVYDAVTATASSGTIRTVGFPADLVISSTRSVADGHVFSDRLRGFANANSSPNGIHLYSQSTNAETGTSPTVYEVWNTAFKDGAYASGQSNVWHNFRRAPGFFDVVCDTGTGAAHAISHNLGTVPELIIRKGRSGATQWEVYSSALANTEKLVLNSTAAKVTDTTAWNSTTPTATQFTVGTGANVNTNGATYVTYLFASLPGISRVGSYTGNGTTQTINCGFTTGARFVLIKRTDSTGDWYVWDTARGIVAANDPHLSLNTTAAEVTTNDSVDPESSGFIVNQDTATNINVNGGSYIFLAIA